LPSSCVLKKKLLDSNAVSSLGDVGHLHFFFPIRVASFSLLSSRASSSSLSIPRSLSAPCRPFISSGTGHTVCVGEVDLLTFKQELYSLNKAAHSLLSVVPTPRRYSARLISVQDIQDKKMGPVGTHSRCTISRSRCRSAFINACHQPMSPSQTVGVEHLLLDFVTLWSERLRHVVPEVKDEEMFPH
jgi:hypothetical protein